MKKNIIFVLAIVGFYWITEVGIENMQSIASNESKKEITTKEGVENMGVKEAVQEYLNDKDINQKAIAVYNSYLQNTKLEGLGDVIWVASKSQEPKLSASLLLSIMLVECGKDFNSFNVRVNNNISGMNWTKDSKYGKNGWYVKYDSIEQSLFDTAERLSKYYLKEGRTTIEAIGEKYAPKDDPREGMYGMNNSKWVENVTRYYEEIMKKIES